LTRYHDSREDEERAIFIFTTQSRESLDINVNGVIGFLFFFHLHTPTVLFIKISQPKLLQEMRDRLD
jgi:hypothetical protein